MKRLLGAAVLVALVAVIVYVWQSRQHERLRQEQEWAARRAATRQQMETLVRRTAARMDWERAIAGNDRFMPLQTYTMDLQRAWVGSQPILFLGKVEDVSAVGEDRYRVLFSYSPHARLILASDRLRLDLLCPKALLDTVLAAQGKRDSDFFGAVAVVARVDHVVSHKPRDSEGVGEAVFTGVGECVDAEYIKDLLLP